MEGLKFYFKVALKSTAVSIKESERAMQIEDVQLSFPCMPSVNSNLLRAEGGEKLQS